MTPNDLQSLFSRPERTHPSTLSVYLNVDQSRCSNWNRGFEKHLRDLLSSVRVTIHEPRELERFQTAAHHIQDFVSANVPNARGLAMFFDSVDGFFWHHELGVPVHNQAKWDRELFLQPLANALDQFERYGVVLVDAQRLRLFTVFLDDIEELTPKGFGPNSHLRRVMNAHLRPVVKEVDWLVQNRHAHRLILAGAPEITSELRNLLPKRLALRVIGVVNLTIDTATRDVLSATRGVAQEYEGSTEVQAVKEVVESAGRNRNTVAGLGRTLKALNSDRVRELIYSEGLSLPGFECPKCACLFSQQKPSCPYCGGSFDEVPDVVERAVEHALRKGAKIEVVTGEAAVSLNNAGGIGAFLKTGAAQIRA